jgi:predicted ribosomally synthesized peptide with nif11-like leader
MPKHIFTNEQIEAAKAAKSPEELVAMAKEQGVEITAEQAKAFLTPPIGEISDEELANVAGGGCGGNTSDDFWKCPKCGSRDIVSSDGSTMIGIIKYGPDLIRTNTLCNACQNRWMRLT